MGGLGEGGCGGGLGGFGDVAGGGEGLAVGDWAEVVDFEGWGGDWDRGGEGGGEEEEEGGEDGGGVHIVVGCVVKGVFGGRGGGLECGRLLWLEKFVYIYVDRSDFCIGVEVCRRGWIV